MDETNLTLHTHFQVGEVDPRLFGGFIEHLGRCVYQGLYEPGSSHASPEGFREDVLEDLARLHMTAMRYPGGNFVSGYHWQDGIGPPEKRPVTLDLAWKSKESNQFGTDEFLRMCERMEWTPMVAVNLGTGSPEEARDWVEYCNSPAGTRFADLRAANGRQDPYGVKLWCLGNEMDGPWQIGHVPADEYARRAQQSARMMKGVDPAIEVVACGSCSVGLPTYMEWDRQVLDYCGDLADYVSLHRYVGNGNGDSADFLAVTNAIDRQIEEMDAACRFVQARRKSRKRAFLAFDEWNVWYRARGGDGDGQFAPHLIEEIYNLEDALVTAGFLNSFIRHADVVKIANLAQVVNVIAPVLTQKDATLLQSIFFPFEMFSKRKEGISLRPEVRGPRYEGKTNGPVHYVDCSAILNEDHLHVFVTNRNLHDAAVLNVRVADRAIKKIESAEILTAEDPKAANSFEDPNAVCPSEFQHLKIETSGAVCQLPPLSVAAMTFRV